MIPIKSLKEPAVREKVFRVTPKFLRTSDRVHGYTLLGLREGNGKLVTAEGGEYVKTVHTDAERLFCVENEYFVRNASNTFTRYPRDMTFSVGEDNYVEDIVFYITEAGLASYYIATAEEMFRLGQSGVVLQSTEAPGATCMAVHRERIYLGGSRVIRYSAPLDPHVWSFSADDTGSITLGSTGGDIYSLVSFDDDLICFRKNEVLRIRADGNDLNFSIQTLEYGCGSIYKNSVRNCGSCIVFLTERGIAVFDGTRCRLVRTDLPGSFPQDAHTAAYRGKYYAVMEHEREGACIYVYDTATDTDYLIRAAATMLSGSSYGVYYGHGNYVCRLTERGFHPYVEEESKLSVSLDVSDASGKARYADGVTVMGAGTFTLTLETENAKDTVRCTAGKHVPLHRVLCGKTLALTLISDDPDAEISALNLHFRED